jgi:sugar (pentulose or hexulose) kinase
LAAAIDTPVTVGDVAAEGGAWGIAVLAAFAASNPVHTLADYLISEVFAGADLRAIAPDPNDVAGFNTFMQRYVAALPVQLAATQHA